jgi:predicted DNA-binding protein
MKRSKRINEAVGDSLTDVLAGGADASLSTPDTTVPMVSRSLRLPLDTYERLQAAAAERHLPITTLMRDLIEAGLAELDDKATVPLADVRRALAALAARAA